MRACVFSGPTLSADEIAAVCPAEALPPAVMGDVIAAVQNGFDRIGIIDGYFDGQPSVWHKEVLWAINQGVTVYGAASIGALRAAELGPFGMIGVGAIFEDYASGRLEDDDEVALIHGPRELGYPPLSEPMVNIRATLARAVADGLIDQAMATGLEGFAKALHFSDRTWPRLLEQSAAAGQGAEALGRLRSWLPGNHVDQKKRDALRLLEVMCETRAPVTTDVRFEWTVMWDRALSYRQARTEEDSTARVLDELRLSPVRFADVRRRALARFLASRKHGAAGAADARDLPALLQVLRRDLGLFSRDQLEDWLEANGLDEAGLKRLLETDAALTAAEDHAGEALDGATLDELRRMGLFHDLSTRAQEKRTALASLMLRDRTASLPGDALLVEWFAQAADAQLHSEDPEDLARRLALRDRSDVLRLIAEEFLFRKHSADKDKG